MRSGSSNKSCVCMDKPRWKVGFIPRASLPFRKLITSVRGWDSVMREPGSGCLDRTAAGVGAGASELGAGVDGVCCRPRRRRATFSSKAAPSRSPYTLHMAPISTPPPFHQPTSPRHLPSNTYTLGRLHSGERLTRPGKNVLLGVGNEGSYDLVVLSGIVLYRL